MILLFRCCPWVRALQRLERPRWRRSGHQRGRVRLEQVTPPPCTPFVCSQPACILLSVTGEGCRHMNKFSGWLGWKQSTKAWRKTGPSTSRTPSPPKPRQLSQPCAGTSLVSHPLVSLFLLPFSSPFCFLSRPRAGSRNVTCTRVAYQTPAPSIHIHQSFSARCSRCSISVHNRTAEFIHHASRHH